MKYPYARHQITKEDEEAVLRALRSSFITRGPEVTQLEEALCEFTGAKFCIAFSNASAALWACCQAVNASEKDLAIVPANTFVASATCAMNQNTRLSLADVDPHTGNMDLDAFEKNLSKHPQSRRIIIPVHITGKAIDMNRLSGMALDWNDIIIEDAAHAIGSYYPSGEKVGSCAYSDMTVFSFHACKNITGGEGGAVMTNDESLAVRIKQIRDSGIRRATFPASYDVLEIAVNTNMTDMQAALIRSQLERIEEIQKHKTLLLERYQHHLGDKLVSLPDHNTHYHLCIAHLTKGSDFEARALLMKNLLEKGIGTQIHYPAMYNLTVVRKYTRWIERAQDKLNWPGMESYHLNAISLPLYPDLACESVDEICKTIHKLIST